MSKAREYWTFLTRAIHAPATIGAIAPTSGHVANAVAGVIPSFGDPVVVELGPGTGAVSTAIRRRLGTRGRHLAVELDPEMVRFLRSDKPWLQVVEGDAGQLRELLAQVDVTRVDALITSIPWTLLEPAEQYRLLRESAQSLAPNGVFTTITYVTTLWRSATRTFVQALHEHFDEVVPRATVWPNVPPARIYVCRRPLLTAPGR